MGQLALVQVILQISLQSPSHTLIPTPPLTHPPEAANKQVLKPTHSLPPQHSRDRFPFNNFTSYLTPFSRCFSSFPHGTCSLSVSRHYLAFDGVYHPFELHSQATRLVDAHREHYALARRDCHPLWCPFPEDLASTHRSHTHVFILQLPKGIPNLSSSCFTRRY